MAEASVGRRWIAYEGRRVPKIARVVEVFLHATRTRVPPERNLSVLARAAYGDTDAELRGDKTGHRPQIG